MASAKHGNVQVMLLREQQRFGYIIGIGDLNNNSLCNRTH